MNIPFFLKEPAWKIFIVSVMPVIFGLLLSAVTKSAAFVQLSLFLRLLVEVAWIYSACDFLAEKYAHRLEVPMKRLNITLGIILVSYLVSLTNVLPLQMVRFNNLLLMVMFIYCVYFFARLLVMAEKKRNVSFNDYLSTAILTYFWLIGIWFVQPRINREYAAKE